MRSAESSGLAFDSRLDLARGIDAREMEAWFQPQVGPDERLTGFEALLRWNHPVHGLIRPGQFIPLAEETGLIKMLGSWITTQACRNCKEWSRTGDRGLSVAINASAIQFEQADFAENVAAIVSSTGVDPTRVMIEITETVFIRDLEKAAKQVRTLRAMGMHVALDDFGSGYATFSQCDYCGSFPGNQCRFGDTTCYEGGCGFIEGLARPRSGYGPSRCRAITRDDRLGLEDVLEALLAHQASNGSWRSVRGKAETCWCRSLTLAAQ
jgi:hypothetical protein